MQNRKIDRQDLPFNKDVAHVPEFLLRDCVEKSVKKYLIQLAEQQSTALYEIVLAEVEFPLLKVVMEHTENQSKAAELLGLSRATLRKKLKKYKFIKA